MKSFAYHFLLIMGRGGFPILEVLFGAVFMLFVCTVSESMVTLACRIKASCSKLRPGGISSTHGDCSGSEGGLDTITI